MVRNSAGIEIYQPASTSRRDCKTRAGASDISDTTFVTAYDLSPDERFLTVIVKSVPHFGSLRGV